VTDPRTDRELLVASRVETAAFEELYRRRGSDDPVRRSASGTKSYSAIYLVSGVVDSTSESL
jgi:hypothetical protein